MNLESFKAFLDFNTKPAWPPSSLTVSVKDMIWSGLLTTVEILRVLLDFSYTIYGRCIDVCSLRAPIVWWVNLIQINLQHFRIAATLFGWQLLRDSYDIALILEPWHYKDQIWGLNHERGKLFTFISENSFQIESFFKDDINI